MYKPGAPLQATVQPGVRAAFLPNSSLSLPCRNLPIAPEEPQLIHLLDPRWSMAAGRDSRVSFSSTETSSHHEALHVRPFLSWITDLAPLLPSPENVPALLRKCMNNISLCPCPLYNFPIISNACNFGINSLKCKFKEVRFSSIHSTFKHYSAY